MENIMKLIYNSILLVFLLSCSANKKMQAIGEMPACLQEKINAMIAEPNGSPQSVTRFTYKKQTVYYMISPCCDKYNIVYDSACNILGYPDGGYTGKGDGKMTDFKNEAGEGKVVWEKK
jgi:hypothetical protein